MLGFVRGFTDTVVITMFFVRTVAIILGASLGTLSGVPHTSWHGALLVVSLVLIAILYICSFSFALFYNPLKHIKYYSLKSVVLVREL